MAVVDPVFEELLEKEGDEKRGLWRVQNLELVPVPEGHWGQFYDGDCYLLLDKNQEEEHVGTNTWNMLLNPLFLVA